MSCYFIIFRPVALHRKILIGFGVGAALGLCLHAVFPSSPPFLSAFLDYAAEPAGRLFLRLLLMAVLPLVVSSLILGVAEMGGAAKLGRVALKTLGFTLAATSLSVLTGLAFVRALKPGQGFPMAVREEIMRRGKLPAPAAAEGGAVSRLLALIPDNPVKAAASGDFLGVMFFALLFGVGVTRADPEKTGPLLRWLEAVYEAAMGFISLVMRLAPVGVGALVLNLTARHGYDLLKHLFGYAAVVVGALAFHQFVTYSILAKTLGGMSPRLFFSRIQDAMLTAFGTSSSSATLPVSMRVGERDLGLPRDISRFVLTVGASANQNGTALYEGVTALFLAQCFGVELTLCQQGTVLAMAILGGVGTAGVPGGSLPMLMAILASIGVPPEGALLILGVDRFLDMCRTVLNVSGDLLIAMLVARSESAEARS
ncbi:MAG: dicarboxylate/amino acid:cation symporter [Elusimicrobia bacterium]|nr:dicarboxylate/amino acid:cation symporter [Elusimicrobiota bacterium]